MLSTQKSNVISTNGRDFSKRLDGMQSRKDLSLSFEMTSFRKIIKLLITLSLAHLAFERMSKISSKIFQLDLT